MDEPISTIGEAEALAKLAMKRLAEGKGEISLQDVALTSIALGLSALAQVALEISIDLEVIAENLQDGNDLMRVEE